MNVIEQQRGWQDMKNLFQPGIVNRRKVFSRFLFLLLGWSRMFAGEVELNSGCDQRVVHALGVHVALDVAEGRAGVIDSIKDS